MTESDWCSLLHNIADMVVHKDFIKASDRLYGHRTSFDASQYQCAKDLDRAICQMKRDGGAGKGAFMTRLNRILCANGDRGLFHDSARRGIEKIRQLAENYGADSKTIAGIQQAYQRLQEQVLDPINKHALVELQKYCTADVNSTITMTTKTSTELQAELDAALKAEAAAAEAKAKTDDLQYHVDLAAATTVLLCSIQSPKSPVRGDLLARFRKELAPLARHFGAKIVLVGDRTSALLVQA